MKISPMIKTIMLLVIVAAGISSFASTGLVHAGIGTSPIIIQDLLVAEANVEGTIVNNSGEFVFMKTINIQVDTDPTQVGLQSLVVPFTVSLKDGEAADFSIPLKDVQDNEIILTKATILMAQGESLTLDKPSRQFLGQEVIFEGIGTSP